MTIVDERQKAQRASTKARSSLEQSQRPGAKVTSNGKIKDMMAPTISTEMPFVAFRRNMFISFLVDKLSDGRHKYGNSDWWILQVQNSRTPAIALDALITKFFGQANFQKDFVTEGTKYYTQALSSLRKDLASPEAFSLGTLAATSALSMFELITFSSHNGWIQHAGGLARLLQARGPWRHKNDLERKVFLENRILLIGQAMISRKRTFLEEHNWTSVPWEDSPEAKEPFDYLIDIGCSIPGMLEDIDNLSQDCNATDRIDREELFLGLVRRSNQAFDELDAWWRSWATMHLDSCTKKSPDPKTKLSFDEGGPVFDSVLHFQSYWDCYVTIFHNALRIILLSVWEQYCQLRYAERHSIRSPNDETNPLPLLGISTDREGLALEIFRCIEFCESLTRNFMGNSCILFPIYYAQQNVNLISREGRWVLSLPKRRLESFKTFEADTVNEGLPSCGRGLFGIKVMSNSEIQNQVIGQY